MRERVQSFLEKSTGIIIFIIVELIYLANLLNAEQVSLLNAFSIQTNPNYFVLIAIFPSLLINLVIMIKMTMRYLKVRNKVAFYMLSYSIFISITLIFTVLAYSTTGKGKLAIFSDRSIFIGFVISAFYLYLFMNEVFRIDTIKISILEKIIIITSVIAPLLSTAFRQTHNIPEILEGVALGFGIIVIFYANFGIAYHSMKVSRKMKKEHMSTDESSKGFRYIFLGSIFQIIFTVCFAIIVLEELYKTAFFYFTMMMVAIMIILFYKGYVKPK